MYTLCTGGIGRPSDMCMCVHLAACVHVYCRKTEDDKPKKSIFDEIEDEADPMFDDSPKKEAKKEVKKSPKVCVRVCVWGGM